MSATTNLISNNIFSTQQQKNRDYSRSLSNDSRSKNQYKYKKYTNTIVRKPRYEKQSEVVYTFA